MRKILVSYFLPHAEVYNMSKLKVNLKVIFSKGVNPFNLSMKN